MVDCGGGESSNGKSRFVCPNDRQLALRAKLKTGWSVKTGSIGYSAGNVGSQTPLGPDEQAAILEVIRRAEQLEISEQERVGKLVERLENMRKNALGRSSAQCLLCGDGFGMLGAQSVLCLDCRRLVCQKCAVEGLVNNKQYSSKEQWLCMICAETREIWKKSGAWFFKSLPKYIMPGQAGKRHSDVGRYPKDDDSSSEDEKKCWSKIGRRCSTTESAIGIDVHEPPLLPPTSSSSLLGHHHHHPYQDASLPASYQRQGSTTESVRSNSIVTDVWIHPVDVQNLGRHWEEMYGGSEGPTSSAKISSYAGGRRDSLTSRSPSEWTWSESKSDDRVSPSASSISSGFKNSSLDDAKQATTVDSSMGTIELSLAYDPISSTLHCTVYRAKNLIPMDINGLADPFCKLNIMPTAKMSTRLRTKTVHKTRNPEFNENLTFYDISETDLAKKALHVLVFDDDKYGHDYMGETRIGLNKLRTQNTIYLTLPLENLRPEVHGPLMSVADTSQWFEDLWSRGQILLSLSYNTKRRSLLVTVVRCTNLLPMDNNGYSDPFIKLHLKPDPYHRKHKTSIKWKNLNPVYNEEFAFETRPTELSTQSLYITVWDKDYGKSNDYLGGLILGGVGSKGHRLKHWLDMIRYPDHRHESWHNLTEDALQV